MTPTADALLALADRVRTLAPRRGDPEAFHVEKSDIEASLRRIARRLADREPATEQQR